MGEPPSDRANVLVPLGGAAERGAAERGAAERGAAEPPQVRTSANCPIEVAWVTDELPPGGGRIGVTFAPGKQADSNFGAPWKRDLVADLDRLRSEFDIQLLVSLIEDHELRLLHIPQLEQRALERGIVIVRSPIRDLHAPTQQQASFLADLALSSARAGRNVIVHCRGGLGRAGTIAACCLVRLGQTADDAVENVRRVRKGAIETREQTKFIAEFASAPA